MSSDPPAFPRSHPSSSTLSRLDANLTCAICKGLPMEAPVGLACGHAFCSACIRDSLTTTRRCPSCDEPAKEADLRRERALEACAEAWMEARTSIHSLLVKQEEAREARHAGPSRPASKKRRISDDSRQAASRATSQGADDVIEVMSSDESDDDVEDDLNRLVECPLCSRPVPHGRINAHMDRGCQDPVAQKPSGSAWKDIFAGAAAATSDSPPADERLTKPNFALATPKDLRRDLERWELPTHGDKPQLEARLRTWITLYNSNLDRSSPRSLHSLRAELAKQEKGRQRDREDAERAKKIYKGDEETSKKPNGFSALVTNNNNISSTDSDDDAIFRRLTAEARARMQAKKNREEGGAEGGIAEKG